MAEVINIEFDLSPLNEALRRLSERAGDLAPVMRRVAGIMMDEVEENFARQGRPQWKALSEKTIRQRAKKGYWPGKILQMRGELAASVQENSTPESAAVSTNRRYAAIQHLGGKAGRGRKVNIPARPFLAISPQGIQDIQDAIADYLSGE